MKPILSALALVSTALLAACDPFGAPFEGLPAKPLLKKSFADTAVRKQLDAVGAVRVLLSCDAKTKTVSGKFNFWAMDGRKPVTVAGSTPCTEEGALFVWEDPKSVYARENYNVDLIEQELQALLTKGAISPMVFNPDHEAAAREIEHSFRGAIQARGLRHADFTCEKNGEGYHYVFFGARREVVRGTLKTQCAKAHQNFSVGWRDSVMMSEAEREAKPELRVRDFNGVALGTIVTAFGELIGDGLPQSKF